MEINKLRWVEQGKLISYDGNVCIPVMVSKLKENNYQIALVCPDVNNGAQFNIESDLSNVHPVGAMTSEQIIERLKCLNELLNEIQESKRIAMLAEESEYKDGYRKAMTNVIQVIKENMRITSQGGDPTIR